MKEPPYNREPESTHIIAFKDCDAFGMLYNTRYLDYFMDARAEHLMAHYGWDFHEVLQRTNEGWVVQGHEIRYNEPARAHETIYIRTRTIAYDANRCLVECLMLNEPRTRLKAVQWTRLSYLDASKGALKDHPDAILRFLENMKVQEDVPEPLQFESRVDALRARFASRRKAT